MESRTSKRPDVHPFQELYISFGILIRKTGEELKKLMDKNPFVQTVVNVAIQQIIIMVFQLAFTKQAKIADIKTPIPSPGVGVIGIPSPVGTTGWGIGDDGLPFDYSCGEWYNGLFYRGGVHNLSHPLCTNKPSLLPVLDLGDFAPLSTPSAPEPAPGPPWWTGLTIPSYGGGFIGNATDRLADTIGKEGAKWCREQRESRLSNTT